MATVRGAEPTGSVALRQSAPSPASVASWPILTAVPLPHGGLADAKQARLLDAEGKEIPAAFEALSHWSPERKSVKWLRVAFSAPTVEGRSPDYLLNFGRGVSAQPKLTY